MFTSAKRGAGSDANVHLNIYGTHGDTGPRPLRHSSTHTNKFEAGHCDEFVVRAVDLGDLEKVRVGHDNSGAGPGWLLEKIVVTSPVTSKSVEFPCGRWLDRHEVQPLLSMLYLVR